jgi:hypothetical protein
MIKVHQLNAELKLCTLAHFDEKQSNNGHEKRTGRIAVSIRQLLRHILSAGHTHCRRILRVRRKSTLVNLKEKLKLCVCVYIYIYIYIYMYVCFVCVCVCVCMYVCIYICAFAYISRTDKLTCTKIGMLIS